MTKQKSFYKYIFVFGIKLLVRIIILLIVGCISYKGAKFVKVDAANAVVIIVTVLGVFVSIIDIVNNDYKNSFRKK